MTDDPGTLSPQDPASDPDDALIKLAQEVRELAASVAESTATVAAATVAAAEATTVAREIAATAVKEAKAAAVHETAERRRSSRRRVRVGVAASIIVVSLGYLGFDTYRDDRCAAGNDLRAATVDGYGLTVEETAADPSVGLPAAQAQALGERVRERIAQDPRFAPKSC